MSEHVVVVGAGTMGAGIAQLCAQHGHAVTLVDVAPEPLERARGAMRSSLARLAAKGRLAGDPEGVLARVRPVVAAGGAIGTEEPAGVGIEAVFEDAALKRRVLPRLERACRPDALLATNTSGIPVGELAGALQAPERFVGLHFFNPVVLMRTVEVVRGPRTSDEAFALAAGWARGLGKQPLLVHRDVPGIVLNRINMAASNEAIRLVQDGVAAPEEIDAGVQGAFGWRMGPFETMDLVGLDVVLAARSQVFDQTGDPRFEPPALLRELVDAGHLGRKRGRGFYRYEDPADG